MKEAPFSIEEVIRMFPIKITTSSGSAIYAICPWCGGKGTLHINSQDDVWNCPRCNHGGGVLDFYIEMNNMTGINARRQAYHDICRYLNIENPRRQPMNAKNERDNFKKYPITKGKARNLHSCELTNVSCLHRTYNTLLNVLDLTDTHRKKLMDRGLTEEEIEQGRFRSVPTVNHKQIIDALLKYGCNFNGVPGFYYEELGGWKMNISQKGSGIFVPYMNKEGFIVGMQIRLDQPKNNNKYVWFSSVRKEYGCSSGSPVHYIGDPMAEKVAITEGALKGTIAHNISSRLGLPITFACVAGSSQYKTIRALMSELKESGCKVVYECFDMDKYKNPYVFKSLKKFYKIGQEEGLQIVSYNWNAVEIRKMDQDGNSLFNHGSQYKILDKNTGQYLDCTLGSNRSYDTYIVNEKGILVIPEVLINPKSTHDDISCALIEVETGEMIDFEMSVDKDHIEIIDDKIIYTIDSYKGIDDYFKHLDEK